MHLRRKLKKKQNEEDIDVELEYYSKEMKQRLAEVQEDVFRRKRLAK